MNIATQIQFNFDNTYARELEGFYLEIEAASAPVPKMVKFNRKLATELKLEAALLDCQAGAEIFSGSKVPQGANPLAQAYAGHQFGGFSAQLGDGRALLLGEVIDIHGNRRDIQLKGSGRTPFSRGGDGKAALGPVLREYILSEAMHALGIPTTRALAIVTTGENVYRETALPGAVLARIGASHIRIGTFQYFAARGEADKVRQLADYAIARHYPDLRQAANPYLSFLEAVSEAQAQLLAKWMLVGFIHGVMNTDNMTISGETIDYGPCAFMDEYNSSAVFSSIDEQGRYAYQNQPAIAQWNLARLAETLVPLIDEDQTGAVEKATDVIRSFADRYLVFWIDGMRAKLGLKKAEDGDAELASTLFSALDGQNVDFTLFFRRLADAAAGKEDALTNLFNDSATIEPWLAQWRQRLGREDLDEAERVAMMNATNPLYIARNHKVEEALGAAVVDQDFSNFEKLVEVLGQPFDQQAGLEEYTSKAPDDFGPYQTFCGT